MKKNGKRILIIGLDGATFDIINPMVKAGRLPVIGGLMRQGAHGPLISTVPPVTPPAWATFMTGKNPGKHGVFGFYHGSKGSYETEMVTGSAIKAKKFWEYPANKTIGLVDIPMTFPPEPVNGFMISGWPVPSDESVFTHPPELHTEIIREIGEYMIDKTLAGLARDNYVTALQHLYRYTRMRRDAALWLLKEKGPFDLFTIVFRGTDFIQHEAFKFLDPDYRKAHPEASRKFGDIIYQFYEYMDRIVADLINAMGKDAVTIVMSDHGAGPMKKRFYFNRWLRQEGFLSVKKWRSAKALDIRRKPLEDLLEQAGLTYLVQFVPERLKHVKMPYPNATVKPPSNLIDWENTKAFSNLVWTDGVVRINLQGRESRGSVSTADYDRVRDELAEKMKTLNDPETGEPIIGHVHKREDIYHGPYLENAPDLFVLTTETSHVFSPDLGEGPVLEKPENPAPAPHRMDGIFIIHGPDIKKGVILNGLQLSDIAPTVLYLLDTPVPEDMDGNIITEACEQDCLDTKPPVKTGTGNEHELEELDDDLSPEEKMKMEETLKALGYME